MLSKLFALVGQYFILMGKVFSRPEKLPIYRRRIIYEMDALGLNSIGLTAIISVFIGAVITLQMSINLESPFIPKYIIGNIFTERNAGQLLFQIHLSGYAVDCI